MKHKRLISAVLVLMLLVTVMPAAGAEESGNVLHIKTPEDLAELAVNCAEDNYSQDLTVILDTDMDLKGVEFFPIPSFSGVFDGDGHSIINVDTATDGSHQGFFRYIQNGGLVKNLSVSGTVTPGGSKNQLGGIVGVNYGRVEGCSYDGKVAGLNHVGGIAGTNYGSIIGCSSKGIVDGKCCTGGIAGKNEGLIKSCSSDMRVNTSISPKKLDIEHMGLDDLTNFDLTSADDDDVVSDSGGITGYSTGIIEYCTNSGTVGYKHYGYNNGGIAGRQCGYIQGCENYGEVLGRKDIGGIVGQMEPFMILTDSVNLPGELNALHNMVAGTMGNVGSASQQLGSAIGGYVSGAVNGSSGGGAINGDDGGGISSAGSGGISGGSNTGNKHFDEFYDQYGQVAGSIVDSIGGSTGAMAQGLVGISDQLARVILVLANTLTGADRTLIMDISEDMEDADTEGRVRGSTNYGPVTADKNVGGVAGEMGIEYEFDLEGTIGEFFGMGGVLSATYQTKCVNDGNVNKGTVTGKKDNVGGICGRSDIGLIMNGQGYGGVKSTDGGCVGGIVGRSETTVRNSYAMCNVDGCANVGGIAGYGTVITGCGSLVGIDDTTVACCGAIAGWADITKPENVSGNRYVHETLGAVDGISYSGQAEKMSYDSFLRMQGLPAQFSRLELSFAADGKVIKKLEFNYGGTIDESEIPPVPEKEGFSGAWPEYDYSQLYFSDTIEAVYTPRQAAIASKNCRDDSPQSIVLAEGDFGETAALLLNEYSGEGPSPSKGRVLEKWVVQIENPDDSALQKYEIRFAPPETEGSVAIYVYDGENWNKASTSRNGSYITFDSSGDTVIFCAVENEKSSAVIIIAAAAVIAAAVIFVIIKKKKQRAEKTAEEPAGKAEDEVTSDKKLSETEIGDEKPGEAPEAAEEEKNSAAAEKDSGESGRG